MEALRQPSRHSPRSLQPRPLPLLLQLVAGGEIRGQILFPHNLVMPPSSYMPIMLTGARQVPAVVTAATGSATVVRAAQSVGGNTMYVAFLDVGAFETAVTACHIHGPASSTANAGVLKVRMSGRDRLVVLLRRPWLTCDIPAPSTRQQTMPLPSFAWHPFTLPMTNDVDSGMSYFNVHTVANASGEIRGQIVAPPMLPTPKAASAAGAAMTQVRSCKRPFRRIVNTHVQVKLTRTDIVNDRGAFMNPNTFHRRVLHWRCLPPSSPPRCFFSSKWGCRARRF